MTFSQNNKPDEVLDELSSLLGALNIQDKPNKSEKKIELEKECYKTHKNTLEWIIKLYFQNFKIVKILISLTSIEPTKILNLFLKNNKKS